MVGRDCDKGCGFATGDRGECIHHPGRILPSREMVERVKRAKERSMGDGDKWVVLCGNHSPWYTEHLDEAKRHAEELVRGGASSRVYVAKVELIAEVVREPSVAWSTR